MERIDNINKFGQGQTDKPNPRCACAPREHKCRTLGARNVCSRFSHWLSCFLSCSFLCKVCSLVSDALLGPSTLTRVSGLVKQAMFRKIYTFFQLEWYGIYTSLTLRANLARRHDSQRKLNFRTSSSALRRNFHHMVEISSKFISFALIHTQAQTAGHHTKSRSHG